MKGRGGEREGKGWEGGKGGEGKDMGEGAGRGGLIVAMLTTDRYVRDGHMGGWGHNVIIRIDHKDNGIGTRVGGLIIEILILDIVGVEESHIGARGIIIEI